MSQGEKSLPVIFDGSAGVITDGNITLEINRQGCRCLAMLISRPDAVVSKDELIAQCWGKYGTIVSDNTVRQTFFQLRKILGELNLPADTLSTIPRQGYKLTSGRIIFGTIYPVALANESEPVLVITDGVEGDGDEIIKPDAMSDLASSSAGVGNKPCAPAARLRNTGAIAVLGLVIFMAICALRYFQLVTPLSYQKIHQDAEHIYFIQRGFMADNDLIVTRAARYMTQPYLRTFRGKYVYINRSEKQNLSLFVCTGPIEDKKNICTPVTVLGDD